MRDLIPWMQCRQLDRNRMPRRRVRAHRRNRIGIGFQVTLPVGIGPRRFAQHVETRREALVLGLRHPLGGFVNRAAHDEDLAHHLHRLPDRLPDKRLARPRNQPPENTCLFLLGHQCAPDHQPPSAHIDQPRCGLPRVRFPVGIAQFVGDQRIRRFGVRHAQKRFGERQQRHAFGRVQPIFLKKLVHPPARLRRAQIGEHDRPACYDPRTLISAYPRAFQKRFEHLRFGCAVQSGEIGRCGIHDF